MAGVDRFNKNIDYMRLAFSGKKVLPKGMVNKETHRK